MNNKDHLNGQLTSDDDADADADDADDADADDTDDADDADEDDWFIYIVGM